MSEDGKMARVVKLGPPFGADGFEVNLGSLNLRYYSHLEFGEYAEVHANKYCKQFNAVVSLLVSEAEKRGAVKVLERAAFDGCRFCQRVKEGRAAPVELRDGTYYHAGAICQSDSIRSLSALVREKGLEGI